MNSIDNIQCSTTDFAQVIPHIDNTYRKWIFTVLCGVFLITYYLISLNKKMKFRKTFSLLLEINL